MFNQQHKDSGVLEFISALNSKKALIMRDEQGVDLGLADYVRLSDDFLGDVLADQWSGAKGSDAQAVAPAVVAGGLGGICALVSGDAGTGTAADGSVLTHALNWKASSGGLYMRTRFKLDSSAANVCINIGFTDVLATTTLEMPFTISGTTITSNAADAACLVFDTAQTNDFFHAQGVKNNTDTAIKNTEKAPVADTWHIAEVFIDENGHASFWIDGVHEADVANAVTASVALTPVVAIETRTTASKTLHVDFIEVAQLRA